MKRYITPETQIRRYVVMLLATSPVVEIKDGNADGSDIYSKESTGWDLEW